MRLRLVVSAAFLLLAPTTGSAQCSADADNTFKPFSDTVDKPSGHFHWDSSAGPNHVKGGGHLDYAVERNVNNLASTTLKYGWPVGRMRNDALTPSTLDHYCYEISWPNQNKGPLNYGRGNDQTDTKVWEGAEEQKVNTVSAFFSFNIGPPENVRTVSMRFVSSFRKTPEGLFAYDYAFESTGGGMVTLKWGIEKDQNLFENLKNTQVFTVTDKKLIPIVSKEPPSFVFRSLDIVMENKEVAGVDVPMFIPGKSIAAGKAK